MKDAFYIFLLCVLAFAACSKEYADSVTDEGCRVYLAASFHDDIRTRVPYAPSEDDDVDPDVPTSEHPLRTEVWASSTSRVFQNGGKDGTQYDPVNHPEIPYEVSYHTEAHFQSGDPQLLADVIYSKVDTPPIYFVAMSPIGGWQTADGKTASYDFDGSEDVMFAPQVEGSYGNKDAYGNPVWPTLHFRHLLTWLCIEIKAENEDVADIWGKIVDMRIVGNSRVTIDLSRGYDASCVTFSVPSDMKFHAEGNDDVYPPSGGEAIPYVASKEVAYILCAPIMSLKKDTESDERVPEYQIDITTEHRTISVPVDLKTADDTYYEGSTMGKQFTISLTFRMGDNITTGVSVKDWVAEGVSGGNLYE